MSERERLIELLESAESAVYWNSSDQGFIQKIADHLLANGIRMEPKQATSNENKRWIPVTERLPEKLENVLAWCDDCFIEVCYRIGNGWEKTWSNEEIFFVTHWMPLPEAPKEENK